jgi:hypothetical protein
VTSGATHIIEFRAAASAYADAARRAMVSPTAKCAKLVRVDADTLQLGDAPRTDDGLASRWAATRPRKARID